MSACPCFTEIERLHQFFEDWFTGRRGYDDFDEGVSALVPGFTIVTPDGQSRDRVAILQAVRAGYGERSPDFGISTLARGCIRLGGVHVARYEEHHRGPGSSRRITTAVLTEVGTGYVWHGVHETWIDAATGP